MFPRQVKVIEEELSFLKTQAFSDRVIYPKNCIDPALDISTLEEVLSGELRTVVVSSDRSSIWQTFLMLFDPLLCLRTVELDQIIKSPEKSLPKEAREWSRKVRNSPFLGVIDQILEALEKQVVSQKDLASIVCGGNLQKVCGICNKEITVQQVVSIRGSGIILGTPFVMFHPGLDNLFFCGTKACAAQSQDLPVEALSWTTAVLAAKSQLRPTRCDFCFLLAPVDEVHR